MLSKKNSTHEIKIIGERATSLLKKRFFNFRRIENKTKESFNSLNSKQRTTTPPTLFRKMKIDVKTAVFIPADESKEIKEINHIDLDSKDSHKQLDDIFKRPNTSFTLKGSSGSRIPIDGYFIVWHRTAENDEEHNKRASFFAGNHNIRGDCIIFLERDDRDGYKDFTKDMFLDCLKKRGYKKPQKKERTVTGVLVEPSGKQSPRAVTFCDGQAIIDFLGYTTTSVAIYETYDKLINDDKTRFSVSRVRSGGFLIMTINQPKYPTECPVNIPVTKMLGYAVRGRALIFTLNFDADHVTDLFKINSITEEQAPVAEKSQSMSLKTVKAVYIPADENKLCYEVDLLVKDPSKSSCDLLPSIGSVGHMSLSYNELDVKAQDLSSDKKCTYVVWCVTWHKCDSSHNGRVNRLFPEYDFVDDVILQMVNGDSDESKDFSKDLFDKYLEAINREESIEKSPRNYLETVKSLHIPADDRYPVRVVDVATGSNTKPAVQVLLGDFCVDSNSFKLEKIDKLGGIYKNIVCVVWYISRGNMRGNVRGNARFNNMSSTVPPFRGDVIIQRINLRTGKVEDFDKGIFDKCMALTENKEDMVTAVIVPSDSSIPAREFMFPKDDRKSRISGVCNELGVCVDYLEINTIMKNDVSSALWKNAELVPVDMNTDARAYRICSYEWAKEHNIRVQPMFPNGLKSGEILIIKYNSQGEYEDFTLNMFNTAMDILECGEYENQSTSEKETNKVKPPITNSTSSEDTPLCPIEKWEPLHWSKLNDMLDIIFSEGQIIQMNGYFLSNWRSEFCKSLTVDSISRFKAVVESRIMTGKSNNRSSPNHSHINHSRIPSYILSASLRVANITRATSIIKWIESKTVQTVDTYEVQSKLIEITRDYFKEIFSSVEEFDIEKIASNSYKTFMEDLKFLTEFPDLTAEYLSKRNFFLNYGILEASYKNGFIIIDYKTREMNLKYNNQLRVEILGLPYIKRVD